MDGMERKDCIYMTNANGSHWIRDAKRLACYIRDGLECAWCGDSVEYGAQLTLDHLIPRAEGGGNEQTNLVTSCRRCNSSRGTRRVEAFARSVAVYLDHGIKASDIIRHIRETVTRDIDVNAARELIARRGGFRDAVYN